MFGCFYKNELENKMPGMTIENIAAACEGTFVGDRNLVTKEIAGAVTDSRQVQKDYLLIPIKGHVWMVMILSRRYLKREHW